jgi:dipeptidyl aminopeptidase/acylaminoacyl peptidase
VASIHVLAAIATTFALAGFTPFTTAPDGGRILQGTFPGTVRAGYVYLPPGFDPRTRYPVVYLLHGLPGSPVEYVHSLDFGALADAAIAAGALRPFIAVMPSAGGSQT